MRLKPAYWFVIAVVAAVAVAFLVAGLVSSGRRGDRAEAKPVATLPSVQVILAQEQLRPYLIRLRGRTQATRTVEVRSETAGLVVRASAPEGGVVRRGTVLCQLSVDARQAELDEARAALRSRKLQRQASETLAAKGYRSATQVLTDQASLDAAQAAVRQAEIALEQVNIRAPFAGVFDRRAAEVGSYLSAGQACGVLIELDPLLVVGDVPETEAGRLKVGAPALATLLSGQTLSGRVRYVARDADPQTRTYHLEIAVPNPSLAIRAGLSAQVAANVGAGPAHLAPVSALVLDAAGRQGLRHVVGDRVAFAPVAVLEETPQGVWVSGLRGPARVITVGQSYVAEGQKVRVVAAR